MKKFLTVLLVIAVMFTFSFGSAFAAAATAPQAKLLAEAKAYAEGIVAANYETAYKAVVKDTLKYAPTSITQKAAWDAIDVKAALQAHIDAKYAAAAANFDAYTSYTTKATLAGAVFATATGYISESNGTAAVIASEELADAIFDLCEEAVTLYAFAADREAVLAGFDKVDYSVYSAVEKDKTTGKTYLTLAEEQVAAGKIAAGDAAWVFEPETFPDANLIHLTAAMGTLKDKVAEYITEKTIDVNGTAVGLGIFYAKDIKTISGLEGDKLVNEATAATYKARIAAVVAEYMKNTVSPNKTLVANFQEVFNYLAEEANTDAEFNLVLTSVENYGLGALTASERTYMSDAVAAVEAMDAYAAKYAAEKDATGALVRDAEDVADLADEYQEKAYLAVCDYIRTAADNMPSASAYEAKIEAATIASDAAELAFAKEVAKEDLAKALAAVIDDYYPLEAAKVQAKYDKYMANVEAAKTVKAVKDAVATINLTSGINDADTVDGLVSYADGTPADKAYDAIVAYINYANYGKNVLNGEFIVADADAIKDAINTIYGEAGARKVSELKATVVDAATVVAGLPTVADVTAAKAAADAACAALPTKATLADKAAIEEAFKLVNDYKDLCADVTTYVELSYEGSLNTAITQLFAEMQYDFAKKIAAVSKTDKAALNALQDEIDAANDLIDDLDADTDDLFNGKSPKFDNSEVVATALENIQKAELAAVIKAINAIPVNVTQADVAVVEAARALYDAYVAEYTDYTDFDDYYAAGAVENFRELALAEAALGLNAPEEVDAAYSVEALKITASSKATKGAITVKWTVEGDTDAVEGYEIWKSTKKNSGYKKAFTATKMSYKNTKGLQKGTRYFYKVRAIAYTAEGEKVKSDWSNKAYRVAK